GMGQGSQFGGVREKRSRLTRGRADGAARGSGEFEDVRPTGETAYPTSPAVGTPTLKYLAAGWWTITAVVDCSGSSWNCSLRASPIRSGRSRSNSLVWSSNSGQAG